MDATLQRQSPTERKRKVWVNYNDNYFLTSRSTTESFHWKFDCFTKDQTHAAQDNIPLNQNRR